MAITVYRTPQRRDDEVSVSTSGETLTINGQNFDLSGVDAPTEINSDFVAGPVFRLNGDVHVRVVQSYGAGETPPADDVMPEPPQEEQLLDALTARQIRLGLVLNGISLDQVGAAIDAIENDQDRAVAKVEWEWASSFERNHPLLQQVGASLGLSEDQIDAMWEQARIL